MPVFAAWLTDIQPGVWMIWAVAAVVLSLTVMVARRPLRPGTPLPQDSRNVRVITATGTPPASTQGIVMLLLCMVFLGAAMLILAHNAIHGGRGWTPESVVGWTLFAFAFAPGIVVKNVRANGWRWIYEKLERADYQGALALANKLHRFFPQIVMIRYMRGIVLLYAGKLDDAEQALRQCLATPHAAHLQAIHLTTLGEVLMAKGKIKEAADLFEQASRIFPAYSGSYGGLAAALLRQDRDPQRALELLDQALQLKETNPQTKNIDKHSLANLWATRAEALAMLGRTSEAEAAIETASKEGNPAFRGGTAATIFRCGRALLRMDRESAAIGLFKRATEIDPHGLYGGLAAKALRERPVSV